MSKLKWAKHLSLGALLEVEMFKVYTVVARRPFQVKMSKTLHVRTTFGRSDVVSHGRRKGFCTLSKMRKTWGFCCSFNHNHHYTTLHSTPLHYTNYNYNYNYNLHYITLHYTQLHYTTTTATTILHYTTLLVLHELHYTRLVTLHSTPVSRFTFSRAWNFFLLGLSLLWSSFFFSSLTLPISASHLSILLEVWLLNFLRQLYNYNNYYNYYNYYNYGMLHYITLHSAILHCTPLHHATPHHTTLD